MEGGAQAQTRASASCSAHSIIESSLDRPTVFLSTSRFFFLLRVFYRL